MMKRFAILLGSLIPVVGLGSPLQQLILVVRNNTNTALTYRDVYAPNEPPGTVQSVIVNPRYLPPHQQTRVTILFTGTLGLVASVNFTDSYLNALTFGFNDPPQYYPGGEAYFRTTNAKLSASVTKVFNPKPVAQGLLWTKLDYQLHD